MKISPKTKATVNAWSLYAAAICIALYIANESSKNGITIFNPDTTYLVGMSVASVIAIIAYVQHRLAIARINKTMMLPHFHIAAGGREIGSLPLPDIHRRINQGTLSPTDHYLDPSSNQWQPIATLLSPRR
jgi:hypothetical protein